MADNYRIIVSGEVSMIKMKCCGLGSGGGSLDVEDRGEERKCLWLRVESEEGKVCGT